GAVGRAPLSKSAWCVAGLVTNSSVVLMALTVRVGGAPRRPTPIHGRRGILGPTGRSSAERRKAHNVRGTQRVPPDPVRRGGAGSGTALGDRRRARGRRRRLHLCAR